MATLEPREEVLILRMYNQKYIGMEYTALWKIEAKVEWADIERKYQGTGDFQAAIKRLFHYGLVDDHGKSRNVGSLSKKGTDYAYYLFNEKKYPEESNSTRKSLANTKRMRWYVAGTGWNGRDSRWALANDGGFEKVTKSRQVANEVADYLALKEALALSAEGDEIFSDSEHVVFQLNEKRRPSDAKVKELHDECSDFMARKRVTVSITSRSDNKARRLLRRDG